MTPQTTQSYLDAIPLPAVFVGLDSRIRGANSRAVAINSNAGETRPFVLVFRQPSLSEAVDNCLSDRKPQKAIYHHSDGPHMVRYDVSLAFVDAGEEAGVLLCFNDVTHLEQADQMRRDFVANVSHELRSPLTAILGFIETLLGPARDDAAAQTRFLGIMSAEAGRMNRLVGDLLSLSKVEEDARRRPTTEIDMDALMRAAIRNLSPIAEENGSTVTYDAPENPTLVAADQDQMMQVFTNLIENALKYGGQGTKVTITTYEVDRDSTLGRAARCFDIVDNGPGIDPEHIPRLTERFYRIDSHRSREMGGTGLGLAIVKHILNRHRGRLRIESTRDKGSKFTVVLPK
ncbi:ATP-binding protein [uncultured Shimia sp.]|uniref:ATP-binding protein n=1 Tax=uncultured Shimia sp. TaxID=573152 RepID=UPI002639A597|nr:ATP-binding protein [uncultured Shimia sp.]